jgi:glc operon protein GlcG
MNLTLEQAQTAIAAAIAFATKNNIAICACVCDPGGRLVAFARMDESNWASVHGSQGKALTAAATRSRSGTIPPTSVVMQRIAELEGNNMIYAKGAVPLLKGGSLLGAIGVGGASADLDEECALAGATAVGCEA